MHPKISFCLLLLASAVAACGGGDASTTRITLSGSSTIAPVIAEIASRYEMQHPEVRIDVQTGGSSRGIRDAIDGLADFGMSSRALKQGEAPELESRVLARDGVAFLVHASNPVSMLSNGQLLDIYRGKIDNWAQLGGLDAPITVITRAAGRSEFTLFSDYFGFPANDIAADLIAGENQQAIKSVIGNPNAIVYISIGSSEYEIQHGQPLKLLPLDGVAASSQTIASGQFPMGRVLLLLHQPGLSPAAQAFLDYALSAEVSDLIEAQGFVAQSH